MRHTIHAGYQRYVDSEDLTRSSNGWGSITVPGGRLSFQGTADLLPGARSRSRATGRRRRSTPSTSSQSIEVNDTIALEQLDVQRRACWPATTRSTARACRTTRRRCRASCWRPATEQVQDVRDPVQQDAPAAPRRDLGLQRQGHGLRQLRALQPGGQLAAARRVVGPQPRRRRINAYFDAERRAVRAPTRSRSSSGKLFVPDLTPRTIDEIAGRHREAVQPALVGAALRPLPQRQALLGGHQQQRRGIAVRPAAPASRASSTSRT